MGETSFAVDVAELDRVIGRLAAYEATLRDLAADLARRVAHLHHTWDGASAQAHRAAQSEWDTGFTQMRGSLDRMRAAADVAHRNYTSAAEANVQMWEQIQ